MMNRKLLIAGGAVLALAAGGTGIALGTGAGDDGPQQPISGSALEKASAAALAETSGGRVTETEVRDEEGYYEVGVTRSDGSQVDVHLNRDFSVIDASADGAGSDGNESGDSR